MSTQSQTTQMNVAIPVTTHRFLYDFDLHGGAIGAIEIADGFLLPGEYIKQAYVEEVVGDNPTSGGSATIALHVSQANDVLTATAYDNAVFTGTFGACTPVDTAASFVKNTGTTALDLTLTIAGAALTGGSFYINVVKTGQRD